MKNKVVIILIFFVLKPLVLNAKSNMRDTINILSGLTLRYWENKAGDGFCFRYDKKNRNHYHWDSYSMDNFYKKRFWDRYDVRPRSYILKNGKLLMMCGNHVSQEYRIMNITNERLLLKSPLRVVEYKNVGDISEQITVFPPYRWSFKFCKLLTSTEEMTDIVKVTMENSKNNKLKFPNPFKVIVSVRVNRKGRVGEIELIEKSPNDTKYDSFYSLLKSNLKNGMLFTPDMDIETGETFDSYMKYKFPIQCSFH